jgi:hypothetical protein
VVGGTSASVQAFAGMVALLDQETGGRQGNINTTLYSLASISFDAFQDITTGNNQVPCTTGTTNCTNGTLGYVAGVGYDQTTGLGSVNAYNLATEWLSGFSLALNPTSLTISRTSSGTASVQVTAVSDFKGTVQFACTVSSGLTNTTCSVPGTVSGSGSVTLTIANTGAATGFHLFPMSGGRMRGPGLLRIAAVLAGIVGLFFVIRTRARRLGFATIALAVVLTGCGGGSSPSSPTASITSPPTPLVGTVTVTATSGLVSRTAVLAVTIN